MGFDEASVQRAGSGRRIGFLAKLATVALAAAVTAGCNMSGGGGSAGVPAAGGLGPSVSAPTLPVESQPLAAPGGDTAGDQIGTGPVRVGLIVPLTQGSGPSVVGQSLRNAAALALDQTGSQDVTLLAKDDQSSPDAAKAAASALLASGVQVIIGPLYSPDVQQVGAAARAANIPVIAFSTDANVASHGVYLLSFLVENYVDRIVDYAASRGKKSLAALIPQNDYGRLAEAELQQVAARRGIRVESIEHYSAAAQAGPAIQKIAAAANDIDALFIPEQADAMPAIAQLLTANKLDSGRVQILGTGLWNDARVLNLPALQGAWFAAPDASGFAAFAAQYRAKYNSDPTRIATLAYDAVSLVAALAHSRGAQGFSASVLTNPAGFNGADGIFRFRSDGLNERGLSVLAIGNGTTSVVSPAPRSFGTSPGG
jgi:ABC-type branched-subunit amino acid transport system substrate-binding protein